MILAILSGAITILSFWGTYLIFWEAYESAFEKSSLIPLCIYLFLSGLCSMSSYISLRLLKFLSKPACILADIYNSSHKSPDEENETIYSTKRHPLLFMTKETKKCLFSHFKRIAFSFIAAPIHFRSVPYDHFLLICTKKRNHMKKNMAVKR